MHEIICPHCSKAFKIDETGYADILKQVRDSEFDQLLHDRLALAEKEKESAMELARTKLASELQQAAYILHAHPQYKTRPTEFNLIDNQSNRDGATYAHPMGAHC